RWYKYSYRAHGGTCFEFAATTLAPRGAFTDRDSKDPDGDVLAVTAQAFSAFVGGVKSGGLDAG
ncbi:DUF397 domain-containing protein, partial [Streptomyces sp. NPDC058953]|uniref:DUF397 domain-containing protein n=1 Tax=Streptomyces sp. NPDC058953 TaxID=3346676 RepID=UPI0036A5AC41